MQTDGSTTSHSCYCQNLLSKTAVSPQATKSVTELCIWQAERGLSSPLTFLCWNAICWVLQLPHLLALRGQASSSSARGSSLPMQGGRLRLLQRRCATCPVCPAAAGGAWSCRESSCWLCLLLALALEVLGLRCVLLAKVRAWACVEELCTILGLLLRCSRLLLGRWRAWLCLDLCLLPSLLLRGSHLLLGTQLPSIHLKALPVALCSSHSSLSPTALC